MSRRNKIILWFSTVFGALIIFLVCKQIWSELNNSILLVLLIGGFLINYLIERHAENRK
ncbi:hypothetical protein [Metabacillus malikii]|uniref:Uncharacterized protein n=1 Tax=Metabacillus malikii TaxID=1504265 RepID=A0ABT9ZJD3_9BACI|nr:hypothetical protein [Metabacillus malikii]MDQ0232389.1 hypothetical protein [Metabacillus malikii]